MNESPSYGPHDLEELVFQLQADLDFTKHLGGQAATEQLVDSLSRIFGPDFAVLDEEGWRGLLDGSGLRDVVATSRGITVRGEAVNRLRRVGLKQIAIIWFRALALTLRRGYRGVVREALADPRELVEYWGYGVYAGRKLGPGRRLLPTSVPE